MKMRETSGAIAIAASLMFFSGQAAAEFQDFVIDEGSVDGANSALITGDKLNGGYEEVLTVNIDLSFDTQAFANFGQVFANEGANSVPTQLACSIAPQCYNMYAVFSASGNVVPGGFTGTSGTFDLYIDPLQDTTAALTNGSTAPTLSGDTEDYLIATATSAPRLVGIVGVPGAFDFIWDDFTLTAAGEGYFIDPDPFYMITQVNGDFDQFIQEPGQVFITGDVSAVFAVPEPGTLALFGLGLLGLGYQGRRNKK